MKKQLTLLIAVTTMLFQACKKEDLPTESKIAPNENAQNSDFAYFLKGAQPFDIDLPNGKVLHLSQKDNTVFLEGDIVLNDVQIEIIKSQNSGGSQRTLMANLATVWPYGRVPFAINSGFSANDQNTILNAINDWNTASSLHLVPRGSDVSYIEFMPTNTSNNSALGMQGYRQVINLATLFGVDRASAIHEIGHAIGMFHEQSRTDRDNAITINWNNIRPGMAYNFQTYAQLGISGMQIGAFDFNSIMLYPSFIGDPAFVFDPNVPVMQRLNGTTWNASNVLSAGDIETAAFMYGPPFAALRNVPSYAYYDPNGDGFDEEGDVIIEFFSDEARTIPFTLPDPKTISINHSQQTYQYGNNTYSSTNIDYTLPQGANSYILTQYHNFNNSYLGISSGYEYNEYYLRNGFSR